MKPFVEVGLVLAFSFSLPFGCAKTLNEDQTHSHSGLVYEKGAAKPLTGKVMAYHDAKKEKVKFVRRYKKGLLSGTSETWYPNGNRETVKHYLAGKLNGSVEEWYTDGTRKKKEEFLNGKRQGEWQTWKEDGKPKQAGICENGENVEVYEFYKDGSKHMLYRKPGYVPKD